MSVQVKRRRDTATNIATFTPAQGEIIVDTTNNRMIVGDGSTVGGIPAAKLSEIVPNNSTLATIALGANGAALQFGVLETLVTLSGSSTTASVQIPANCYVFSVGSRVVTSITGVPSYGVGVPGNATEFGSALNVAAGSTNTGLLGAPAGVNSATTLTVTATSGSFTGGTVRLSIHYMLMPVSTS